MKRLYNYYEDGTKRKYLYNEQLELNMYSNGNDVTICPIEDTNPTTEPTAEESSSNSTIVEVNTELLEVILQKYVENRNKQKEGLKFKVGEVHNIYTESWEYNPNMIEEQFKVVKRTDNKIYISGRILEDRKSGKYYHYKELEFTINKDQQGNEFYDKAEFCGPFPIIVYPNK